MGVDQQRRAVIVNVGGVTAKMNLADEVDLENFVSRPDPISNADIAVRPLPMHPSCVFIASLEDSTSDTDCSAT